MKNTVTRIAVDPVRTGLLKAIESLAKPLAEIMVRSGVMVRDVNRIFERACVEVANEKLRINGKENLTRVSLLTGIDRKKVARYVDEIRGTPSTGFEQKFDVITTILSVWHSDERYIDEDGHPIPLTKQAPGKSIHSLVKEFGRDVTTTVVVDEMMLSGSLVEEDGYYLPCKQGYFPQSLSTDQMVMFGSAATDLLKTLNYNLFLKRNREDYRFQQSSTVEIPVSEVPEYQEYLHNTLAQGLKEIDQHLTIKRYAARAAEPEEPTIRFGVGFFEIQRSGSSDNSD